MVSIGNGAFSNCSTLTGINIPRSVTTMEREAFYEYTALAHAKFPDNSGITAIEAKTFYGCTSLKEINISNGITVVEDNAFRGCTNLERISFPKSVTKIKDEAFYYCI